MTSNVEYPVFHITFHPDDIVMGIDANDRPCVRHEKSEWQLIELSNTKELESLRVQVAGLTKGISKFMDNENRLHRRLVEVEGALAKRKKQQTTDSKQINELFDDLFLLSNAIIYGANSGGTVKFKEFEFQEFKDWWLRQRGYKV